MFMWLALLIVLVLDRLSKILVQRTMHLGESIPIIPNILHFTYILNPGAAFGLFAGKTWFFVIVTVLVLLAIVYFQTRIPAGNKLLRVSLGLIGGGALGNLYDRLFIGKVIDFLDFKVWSYIFNIADSMIVVGGFVLLFWLYSSDKAKVSAAETKKDV